MPTIYTALCAEHRHKLVVKIPRVPAPDKALVETNLPLLAGEKLLLARAGTRAPVKLKKKRQKRHVVVVGAGLAGLCAAYELCGVEYDVTGYEAQDCVGGRV